MTSPKRHHYLPATYLKGFTVRHSKDDVLHVFDLALGQTYRKTPLTDGYEKHLYRADTIKDEDAGYIELTIAETIDSPTAPILQRIHEQRRLPSSISDLNLLFNFMALQAARVPSKRSTLQEVSNVYARESLRHLAKNPSEFERVRSRAEQAGETFEPRFEDLPTVVEAFESGRITLQLGRNYQNSAMFEFMDGILKMIALRPWSLLIAADAAPDFACSDDPFVVTWPQTHPPDGGHLPTWFRGAQVTFPLTRRMAMISTNQLRGYDSHMCSSWTVNQVNRRVALKAHRFLFAAKPSISFALSGARRRISTDLHVLQTERNRRGLHKVEFMNLPSQTHS